MTQMLSLRELASRVAATEDEDAINGIFQMLRGWANRNVLVGTRLGAGKTSPVGYPIPELVIASVLLSLRRSIGVEGEALHSVAAKLRAFRRSVSGYGDISIAGVQAALLSGEEWWLDIAIGSGRTDQRPALYVQLGPTHTISSVSYDSDPHYAGIGNLRVNLTELLGPVFGVDANA